jgi:hypothetical protein
MMGTPETLKFRPLLATQPGHDAVLLRKLHRALEISKTISGNNCAFPVRLLVFPALQIFFPVRLKNVPVTIFRETQT